MVLLGLMALHGFPEQRAQTYSVHSGINLAESIGRKRSSYLMMDFF